MTKFNTVNFRHWTCQVQFFTYANNGRICIRLHNYTDGPIATASVNLPRIKMSEGEVAIKDYSENEGMMEALLEAGIVYAPHRSVINGFELIEICKLGPVEKPREELRKWLIAIGEISAFEPFDID